ncbi:MAG: hypothetical protein ABL917_03550 [Parcubacteria group bacterium]
MKKYSQSYFEEKFNILYRRLIEKEGFISDIKSVRKQLGIPENGFENALEFSQFLMERLSRKEKEVATSIGFWEQYEVRHGRVKDEDWENVRKEFDKKYKKNFIPLVIMISYQMHLDGHNDFFTTDPVIKYGKNNKNLFKVAKKIFDKFMGLDLLDAHIAMQYVEKYLFLGDNGVKEYIKNKINCPHCRYLGVNHFSPTRISMQGQNKGPFSGDYLFNEHTVKLLSSYFDSVFVIIKPYATKEQVIQYVDENWDILKEHIVEKNTFYKQFDVNPSKIKKSDTDRNKLVYELSKQSKKELLGRYKGQRELALKGIYKETIISAILEEEYQIKLSSDAIKKTVSRFAQSVEVKREPKDIRDI